MDLTRTSKSLSYVLRHNPKSIGLILDKQGWANVADLLSKNKHLTLELLKEVVAKDNKQRYSFNEDGTKIRANQGHSINVDLGLKAVEPPDILFHGTATRFLDSIMENGLVAGTRNHVHLSADNETAVKVGSRHGKPVVLKIKSGEMHKKGIQFYKSENGVWLTNNVPIQYIQR
jgi:putative RNA 2'-phosphotransferase